MVKDRKRIDVKDWIGRWQEMESEALNAAIVADHGLLVAAGNLLVLTENDISAALSCLASDSKGDMVEAAKVRLVQALERTGALSRS